MNQSAFARRVCAPRLATRRCVCRRSTAALAIAQSLQGLPPEVLASQWAIKVLRHIRMGGFPAEKWTIAFVPLFLALTRHIVPHIVRLMPLRVAEGEIRR
jgi:hypothetical protein